MLSALMVAERSIRVTMLLLCLVCLVCEAFAREISPVLIWGNYVSEKPLPDRSALAHTRPLLFQQYLQQLVATRPVILLFTEQSLSVEDFANDVVPGEYPYLYNASKKPGFEYFSSVEGPVHVLHQLTHHGYSLAQYDEESPTTVSSPTILVGRLREPVAGESRQSLLHAHDLHMHEVGQEAIQRYGQVMVIYTGRHASYIPPPYRHKRQVDEEETIENEIVLNDKDPDEKIYVVTKSPIEYRRGTELIYLSVVLYTTKEISKKRYIALDTKFKVSTEETISLDWVFNSPSDLASWSLDSVKIEGIDVEMKVESGNAIQAPGGYSYYCGQDILFTGTDKNGTRHSLFLRTLQTQPRVSENAFGPAADCIPYFSQPIWSGLLVSSLLLGVLVLAVLMLLDIRANDRFDDPKSKSLSITNAE